MDQQKKIMDGWMLKIWFSAPSLSLLCLNSHCNMKKKWFTLVIWLTTEFFISPAYMSGELSKNSGPGESTLPRTLRRSRSLWRWNLISFWFVVDDFYWSADVSTRSPNVEEQVRIRLDTLDVQTLQQQDSGSIRMLQHYCLWMNPADNIFCYHSDDV